MTLSYIETKRFIDLILICTKEEARNRLYQELKNAKYNEPELVAGVIAHGCGMPYTSNQWFDFLSKIPNILFRDEQWLINKLSEKQRQQLNLE